MADSVVKVRGDTSHAVKELEKLDRAIANLNRVSAGATKALAAITAAGAAMGFAVAKTLNSVDELAKTSRRLGMTAADLQAFRNSASLAGVGAEEFTASLQRLQVNIGNALVRGTGPAKEALDRLGISMKELQGLDAGQQFQRIAEEISKIPDPALRAATATELLGKQGPRLLEAANEFERMRREAEQLGLALSATDTAAIERAGDAMNELSMIATGFLQKLTAQIAPILIVIAENIKQSILAMGGLDAVITNRVIPALKIAAQAAAALVAFIAVAKIAAIAIGFARLAIQVIAVARAMRTLGVAAAAAKAIATGGLSAIVTMTAGVAGAIAAAAAAGSAMDRIFEDAKDVTAEIAANAEDVKDAVEGTATAANEVNKAYNDTLARLQENVRLQQDILQFGEEEARIRQVIRQEQEKYSGANANILRNLLEQESSLKNQIQLRDDLTKTAEQLDNQEQNRLVRSGRAFRELLALEKQLNDARVMEAKVADTELASIAQDQLRRTKNLYNEQVKDLMIANSREMKAMEDHMVKIRQIDTIINEAKRQGYDEDFAAYRILLNEKEQLEREYQSKILQLQANRIQQSLMMERGAFARRLQEEDRVVLQKIGAEERQRRAVNDRIEFEKKSEAEKYRFAIDQGAQMFSALGAQNKRAFEAAKAFNIANAIMNTYLAATKALATYPPPFNFIAAAAAVGMGLAQVAQIRSQQYSGRQMGGPIAAGMPYLVGEAGPEIIRAPAGGGTVIPNHNLGGGGAVNVNFTINAIDTQGFDELLVERRGVITTIIQDAMLEQGQRF